MKGNYGVLAPVPSDADDTLDSWYNILVELFEKPKLRQEYSQKAKLRSSEYSESKISKKWYSLIEGL